MRTTTYPPSLAECENIIQAFFFEGRKGLESRASARVKDFSGSDTVVFRLSTNDCGILRRIRRQTRNHAAVSLIGTVLNGKYRIVAELGYGGQGQVFRALDERLNIDVAMKKLELGGISDPDHEFLKAFRREAQILTRLRHPALPVVSDFFEEPSPFIVMDYIQGDNLEKTLKARGAGFPVEVVERWARRLFDVVEYLHANGVIHRDIRPANLVLRQADELMLIDFGLSKAFNSEIALRTTSRSVFGYTKGYAPFEQMDEHGEGTDERCDVYAVGATLYHLLTGSRPVDAVTRGVLMAKPGGGDPLRSLAQVHPHVPARFAEAIVKAMAFDREERFQAIADMRRAIFAPVPVTPVASPPVPPSSGAPTPSVPAGNPNRIVISLPSADVPVHPSPDSTPTVSASLPASRTRITIPIPPPAAPPASPPLNQFQPDIPPTIVAPRGPAFAPSTPGLTLDLGGGVTLLLVEVPAGSFRMGSAGIADESPLRTVTFGNPFYLSAFPITQRQWRALMGTNPSFFKGDDLPVEQVSWENCRAFTERVNQMRRSVRLRLPSEAEWEYACRAGSLSRFSHGDEANPSLANFGNHYGRTTPPGFFPPNAFGLYDMHGNVAEWCADWHHITYVDAPSDGSAKLAPVGTQRILRGGSWAQDADAARSAHRGRLAPVMISRLVGFRVAADAGHGG